MPWKCPQCGVDIPDSLSGHLEANGGCGYVLVPSVVNIRSEVTGKEIAVRLSAGFGSSSLKILDDPEIKFVSPVQFRLDKRQAQGGWFITNEPQAKNPTFLNGEPINMDGVLLRDGDKLSIKDKCFRLILHLVN